VAPALDGAELAASSGMPSHRIDSMDLAALGFTESGDAE
jgi:hypothetical protein